MTIKRDPVGITHDDVVDLLMTPDDNVCWDCIKGRHCICIGGDEEGPCKCPVCAVDPKSICERKPVWTGTEYIDPGANACALGEADTNIGCEYHTRLAEGR